MTPNELEKRLIDFAVSIISISDFIKRNYAGIHLSKQIIRSGTARILTMERQEVQNQKRILFIK